MAYRRWMDRIPDEYRRSVLGQLPESGLAVENDRECLATLKHYRSLMPLAQEAHKPMFRLAPADGAIGGHIQAVQQCYRDFRELALRIAERAKITVPYSISTAETPVDSQRDLHQ
jgi:hypothetical protein